MEVILKGVCVLIMYLVTTDTCFTLRCTVRLGSSRSFGLQSGFFVYCICGRFPFSLQIIRSPGPYDPDILGDLSVVSRCRV